MCDAAFAAVSARWTLRPHARLPAEFSPGRPKPRRANLSLTPPGKQASLGGLEAGEREQRGRRVVIATDATRLMDAVQALDPALGLFWINA